MFRALSREVRQFKLSVCNKNNNMPVERVVVVVVERWCAIRDEQSDSAGVLEVL